MKKWVTGSDVVTGCPRCHSLMVEETFVDLRTTFSMASFTGWRCVVCGEIVDPVILQNRRHHPRSSTAMSLCGEKIPPPAVER